MTWGKPVQVGHSVVRSLQKMPMETMGLGHNLWILKEFDPLIVLMSLQWENSNTVDSRIFSSTAG